MKNLLKIVSLMLFLNLFSCQKEEVIFNDTTNNQSLNISNNVTKLLKRVSQEETSKDNFIDNCACFNVVFPFSVTVKGTFFNVVNENQYVQIRNILNEFNNDNDSVVFNFPITIKFKNYTIQVIQNVSELNAAINLCDSSENVDEISCLNFVYPITVSFYDAGSQTPLVKSFSNDIQFYNFLKTLDENDFFQFNYPINIIGATGNLLIISDNQQLEDTINVEKNICEADIEDDDGDDSNNLPISSTILSNITSSGEWKITYFLDSQDDQDDNEDDNDETAIFNGILFLFNSNETSTISGIIDGSGIWKAFKESNNLNKLRLTFTNAQLLELNNDWEIIEITNSIIRLKDISGSNGETDYLTFEKN